MGWALASDRACGRHRRQRKAAARPRAAWLKAPDGIFPNRMASAHNLLRYNAPARTVMPIFSIASQPDYALALVPVMPGLKKSDTSVWLRVYEVLIVYADASDLPERRSNHGPENADPLPR